MPRELLLQSVLVGVCTLWTVLGLWAVRRRERRTQRLARARRNADGPQEPVWPRPITLVMPLAGCDPDLEDNLERCFRQRHPRHRLLFVVRGAQDPALAVLRRVRARHPGAPATIVVHEGQGALNPKVDNLLGALPLLRTDLVAFVDSNVALAPDFLLRASRRFAERPRLGLLSHPIVAGGARSLADRLEASWLGGPMRSAVAVAHRVGRHPVVVGKALVLRRDVLERLGGLRQLAETLAEDYVLGRLFHEAGWQVELADEPVRQPCGGGTLRRFYARQLRWAMLRARLQPLAFALEPVASPWWVLAQLALWGAFHPALLLWAAGLELLRSVLVPWRAGQRPTVGAWLLAPLRDAVVLAAWSVAPLQRRVRWRGTELRVSAGTRLYRTAEAGRPVGSPSLPPGPPLALAG